MSDGTLIRIETDPDAPFPLGRSIVWHDPENRQHRALPLVAEILPDRATNWYSPEQFDQQGNSCTMQTAVKVAQSGFYRKGFIPYWPLWDTEAERHAGYLRSQLLDPWYGGEPEYGGTTTDAAYKLLRAEGCITGWKWLFSMTEIRQWVMYYGAIGAGTNWYNSMFWPDANGYVSIIDSQGNGGGHEYSLIGYSPTRRAYRIGNSWSAKWGQNGRVWILEETLARLMSENGDAATLPAAGRLNPPT